MGTASTVQPELRATSLSELLDRTFTLYRTNFWLVCGIMVVPELILMVLSLVYIIAFPVRIIIPVQPNPSNPFAAFQGMQSNLLASLVLLILRCVAYAFSLGCMTFAVSEVYLGRKATIRETYANVSRRIPGLSGLMLVLVFIGMVFLFATLLAAGALGAILGGLMAFVSPILTGIIIFLSVIVGMLFGFWLMMRFSVSIPAFVLEKRGVFNSLSRSGELTKGHLWRIFVACLVIFCIVYVVQIVCTAPFSIMMVMHTFQGSIPLWLQIATALSGAISAILASPLLMIMLALIYYDVRIRKEAFDLETMMNALGPAEAPPGGPGPTPPFQAAQ